MTTRLSHDYPRMYFTFYFHAIHLIHWFRLSANPSYDGTRIANHKKMIFFQSPRCFCSNWLTEQQLSLHQIKGDSVSCVFAEGFFDIFMTEFHIKINTKIQIVFNIFKYDQIVEWWVGRGVRKSKELSIELSKISPCKHNTQSQILSSIIFWN